MTAIRVHKMDAQGQFVLHYDGDVLARGETWVCLRAEFKFSKADVGVAQFYLGDIFYEWFYSDRWYNVFRVERGKTGELVGWYCNITRPATITEDGVKADDLALDVFVQPDGGFHLLDEDEFEALMLNDEERRAAFDAVDTLRRLSSKNDGPFELGNSDLQPKN